MVTGGQFYVQSVIMHTGYTVQYSVVYRHAHYLYIGAGATFTNILRIFLNVFLAYMAQFKRFQLKSFLKIAWDLGLGLNVFVRMVGEYGPLTE